MGRRSDGESTALRSARGEVAVSHLLQNAKGHQKQQAEMLEEVPDDFHDRMKPPGAPQQVERQQSPLHFFSGSITLGHAGKHLTRTVSSRAVTQSEGSFVSSVHVMLPM